MRQSVVVAALAMAIFRGAWAADGPAGEHLHLRANEYLVADARESPRMDDGGSWSVQFWLRLGERPPLPFQQRILLARPGAWALIVRRYERHWRPADHDAPLAPALATELALVAHTESGHVGSIGLMDLTHGEWLRISIDLTPGGGGRFEIGGRRREERIAIAVIGGSLPGTQGPLYVGGAPPGAWQDAVDGALPYSPIALTTVELDDLHFATVRRGLDGVKWRARPDEDTAAFWRFDEGERADRYTSMNPHQISLHRATLGVEDETRVATTWGRLRAGHQMVGDGK